MSVTFSDTDTGIEYLGNTLLTTAGVNGFASGELTRTDLFLTKTTVVDTSTSSSYTVDTINTSAFSSNFGADLQSVDFSGMGELTRIGDSAFYRNTNLTALVNFNNATKLRYIGVSAFDRCDLQSVDFSGMGELTNIRDLAFMSNIHLTELVNFNKATKLLRIEEGVFQSCDLWSVDFDGMSNLTEIGFRSFATNINLTALNFGNLNQNLKIFNINTENGTFDGCSSLRQITYQNASFLPKLLPISTRLSGLPGLGAKQLYIQQDASNKVLNIDFQQAENLTSINQDEFANQDKLTALVNFTKATKLQLIDTRAFQQCDLRSVNFSGMGELLTISDSAFLANLNLAVFINFTKATKLQKIGPTAFASCELFVVDFGGMANLTLIDEYAFNSNTNLTGLVNFNKATKLQSIRNSAFAFCDLRLVEFSGMGELLDITGAVFFNNTNLTGLVNFNNATKLQTIGSSAFAFCDLRSLNFNGMSKLTLIDENACFNNRRLNALINFNNATKLESIKQNAFQNCDLRTLNFAGMGELLDINSSAFASNTNLTELNFGNLAQNLVIDSTAFDSCASLRRITYKTTSFLSNLLPISGGEQHMYIQQDASNRVLNVDFQKAGNLTSIFSREFEGQSQLTALVNFNMATKLQSIRESAFGECDLRSVDFGGMGELTMIDFNAFILNSNLTALVNFNMATKLQIIASQAFLRCDLRSVDFSGMGELMAISSNSFQENINLTAIVNLNKLTKLEILAEGVFKYCDLRSVDFDGMSKLEYIYDETFSTNINLTALNFGNLAQDLEIQSAAFQGCTSLRQITYQNTSFLPNLLPISGGTKHMYIQQAANNTVLNIDFQKAINLTSFNGEEFINQDKLIGLNNFNVATKLTSINSNTFKQCTSIQTIFFPGGLSNINASAFNSNISLRTVTFDDPSPSLINVTAFTNCTKLKAIYHFGTNITQLTQLTALASGTLYNLSADKVTSANFATHISTVFDDYDLDTTDPNQVSDIKNIYAANLLKFGSGSAVNVKVGAIPFLAEQLGINPDENLRVFGNYTTPTIRHSIASLRYPTYFQMDPGSILYLDNNATITKNDNDTYTVTSSGMTSMFNAGDVTNIQGRIIIFGGVTIGPGSEPDLGDGFSGISPKPIILVERGNERGANRQIMRRASFFNVNTYIQENPGNNVNYIIDSGMAVKNKTFINKDSSDRTRRLKLKAQNKTYNDLSFGGNESNGSYSALSKVRH